MTPLERAWRGGRNDWRLHVLGIFGVSVAFVCLAASALLVVNVDHLRQAWARAGRASVFLKVGASDAAIADIERALRASPGVEDVRHVTSEAARKDLVGATADPVLSKLPAAAFPASLEITLKDDADASRLAALETSLAALPAVEAVETYGAWTSRLAALLSGGVTAAALLAAVVLCAVVSVVASTIRLSLQRRRIEVEVLKLIGATDDYVRRPFVIEGAAQGAVGALLATSFLGVLYLLVVRGSNGDVSLLLGVRPTFLPWHVIAGMVVLGALMGSVAAHASLRRFTV